MNTNTLGTIGEVLWKQSNQPVRIRGYRSKAQSVEESLSSATTLQKQTGNPRLLKAVSNPGSTKTGAENESKAHLRDVDGIEDSRLEGIVAEELDGTVAHNITKAENEQFRDLDVEGRSPKGPYDTSAETIEPFHPDLYEFMVPWSPWRKAIIQDKSMRPTGRTSADLEVRNNWQDFGDLSEAMDDWQSFAEYEKDVVETPEDLELLKALKDRNFDSGTGYRNWRAYVDSLVEPETEKEPLNRTIHMLGLGAAGKYIAHSIASLPFAPPVSLLTHRPLMMQNWHDEGAAIHVIKGNKIETQSNFHIESSAEFTRKTRDQRFPGFGPRLEYTAEPPNYPIDTLIVTTETYRTVSALEAIKHRLRHSSTILFVNDGLGLAERINEKIFPDPFQRPTYVLGNMTHNLESTERQFTLIEKNQGRLQCSKLPQVFVSRSGRQSPILRRKDYSWTAAASHLVGTLARTPGLNTATLGHKTFYQSQLQNLAAGAVIGPLSVVFDCTNDYILYNYNASQTMKMLLSEISNVIYQLPELQSLPRIRETFDPKKLESIIVSKTLKSGKNLSQMLKAVRAGNRTDIDFYNGYIERRARELGIDTPRNEMMLHLVRGKSASKSREMNNYIPFEDIY